MTFKPPPSTMTRDNFISLFEGVYEHSKWVAEQAWDLGLDASHDNAESLAAHMSAIVNNAGDERQLALILAHPDLAGKAAQTGTLTAESTGEQAGAGIDQCNTQEFAQFQQYNKAYWDKFKFPFIMAVKGSDRFKILRAFEQRLPNDYQTEYQQALSQIHKIAQFRLEEIAHNGKSP